MTKRKRGHPTLYKPEYCGMLIEHFKRGESYTAFAALVDVHLDTLYQWEKDQPDFSEAKKKGWQHYQAWWERQGQEGMYDQTFLESDGSRRILKMNAAVWIYNMKCRFKKDWSETKEIKAEITQPHSEDEKEIKELMAWYRDLKEMK